ncbi:MAG TPA: 7-cyano-7-deazaguanine synthase [Vicinamibacterales bacterium]|nr:7-cyano-7-deazaguanine synthase [Vicinamibacterales bacterium]
MARIAVLFSAGLDSAVLLAHAAHESPDAVIHPIYVSTGLAWEREERAMAERYLTALASTAAIQPLASLTVDMRDVYPSSHWAIRGEPPGYDTPDEDVYLDGRNIVLLSKASVFMARQRIPRIMIGPLAGNPFPDATAVFFETMGRALSIGLDAPITIDAPFVSMKKADVIRLGRALGVPFELTLSCMQPNDGRHCGRCSKCRERIEAFREVGAEDPAKYASA